MILDLKGQKGLEDALRANSKRVHIGIFSEYDARENTEKTNAEIGAKHELGLGVPRRSFLAMPLIDQLTDFVKKEGIGEAEVKEMLKTKSLDPLYNALASAAVKTVGAAFETGGFGKWPKSQSPQTLVETGQLRDSVAAKVVR